VRRVRELLKQIRHLDTILGDYMAQVKKLQTEREVLAMLAARGPAFDNPILAAEATKLRDKVLRECGLNPDGTLVPSVPAPA
jgi:predicted ATPase